MQEVCEQIESPAFGQKLAKALPPGITLDRFTRVTLTAVQQNPELITADRGSLYTAVIRCAQDGLLPDGKAAALVIFNVKGKNVVQYMPMIGGYRQILADHGMILNADVVREKDTFSWSKAPPDVKHTYPFGDRGEMVGAYAVIYDEHGRTLTATAMSAAEIMQVKDVSKTAHSEYSPWNKWSPRMWVKTVGRRAFNEAPLRTLTDREERIVRQADVDSDLPEIEPRMTVVEANVAAAIPASVPVDDSVPDDADWREAVPVDETEGDGEQGSMFEIPESAR